MSDNRLSLHYPFGSAQATGRIKQQASDFQVDEQLGFELSGQGEHLWLYIRKQQLTTQRLVELIAEQLSVSPRKIGYSGLKDKQAVTRQWLSVQLPGRRDMPRIGDHELYQVEHYQWHDRKLRVGSHRSNRFIVVIRDFSGEIDAFEKAINALQSQGFANYFGAQRFGVARDNVEQALASLNNRHKSKRLSRYKKSLYLSALRSELFNRILSRRIGLGLWPQPVAGDAHMLAGSQSLFNETPDEDILRRYRELDLSFAVSLYGSGDSRISARAEQVEQEIEQKSSAICATLAANDVKRAYRASRAIAKSLHWQFQQERQAVTLSVELERGVYLTTLLDHLLQLTGS